MQNIRSKGTGPENIIAGELKKRKIYFAKNVSKITGKPDFVFRRKRVAVFIDSDFWHCNPEKFVMPETNRDYWEKKISRNIRRDQEVNEALEAKGWKVVRIWEHEVRKNCNHAIMKILNSLERRDNNESNNK